MAVKTKQEPQNPLILRCHRLMEAFAKSDDERDFYIDRIEGFLVYVDLDKPEDQLNALYEEVEKNSERYCPIPKLTFYETKKIMEGFVNEKVYDIDTKEKLMDIIQSRQARENFLEFIYDQHAELEKWQQYYQERSRIRIIEWLRQNHFHFVFEEDLDLPVQLIDKLKQNLFETKVDRDIFAARKELSTKSKTYYSNEALNPRPKRGRPPKQAAKLDVTLQSTTDIYTTVASPIRPFLFTPDASGSIAAIFSSKFESEEDLLAHRKLHVVTEQGSELQILQKKLAELRALSQRWIKVPELTKERVRSEPPLVSAEEDEDLFVEPLLKRKKETSVKAPKAAPKKATPAPQAAKPAKKSPEPVARKKPAATKAPPKKAAAKPPVKKVAATKKKAAKAPTKPAKSKNPPQKKKSAPARSKKK